MKGNKDLSTPHGRLADARAEAGFEDAADAADALGVPRPTYFAHENGSRGLARAGQRYAAFFGVNFEWLMTGKGPRKSRTMPRRVRAEGYVGAGDEVIPISNDATAEQIDLPAALGVDAAPFIIRGSSMRPRYFEGETLLVIREKRPPEDLIGRECVVQLADGRIMVKKIRRGTKRHLFHLESYNADLMEDQEVEWASPVVGRINS